MFEAANHSAGEEFDALAKSYLCLSTVHWTSSGVTKTPRNTAVDLATRKRAI
jgi:hypothetical protein